jgi:hypothetical protein
MRGTDDAGYAVGWTKSDLVTLGAILAVWVFAIWTPQPKAAPSRQSKRPQAFTRCGPPGSKLIVYELTPPGKGG